MAKSNVHRLNTPAPVLPSAIRTPEQFTAAVDKALHLASHAMATRDYSCSAELTALTDAIKAAPFLIADGAVIAKGFLPRIVSDNAR